MEKIVSQKDDLSVLWSYAVNHVGGNFNTYNNFRKICNEFKILALNEGYAIREINNEIDILYNALKTQFILI